MSRIAQVANFVSPTSGGIRTVLANLAAGYAASRHEVIQIVPGDRPRSEAMPWGRLLIMPGHRVPGTGYRVLRPGRVRAALARLAPDRLEVHDRSTLRGLGAWARNRDVPALVVAHERLDRLLAQLLPGHVTGERFADWSNLRLAAAFDAVVCTSEWATSEFTRLAVANTHRVPLGVDLHRFRPDAFDPTLRARLAPADAALLVVASRLSPEKRPALAIDAVAELVRRGMPVRLAIAGDGPLRAKLQARARGLPVEFLGHLRRTAQVAALLASADVVLAPGPVETFCLAALESLASGTPVVANSASALPEVLGAAGIAATTSADAWADATQELLLRPARERERAARERAERYDWGSTVRGFLAIHQLTDQASVATMH